ncbi:DUF3078 domain-containing protein [Nonlabens antarcticus]|uniref:DUF3078 domain-containing protein n=1 Tax=Nonlabens antarcticus TaxID=392714 RepID=UPI001890DA61|nr:DUF3078 domain-containing protein [Nonlabens antarcticus]
MKFWMCFILMLMVVSPALSQDAGDDENQPVNGWNNTGTFQFLFNQSAFNNNWTGGGTSSVAGNLNANIELNYTENRARWENSLIVEYGLTKQDEDRFTRKTNDRIEFNSVYGYEVNEGDDSAYYSFFVNAMSQATKGYTYKKDSLGIVQRKERTNFFSPGYIQAGPGYLYKKGDFFTLNLAPSTARLIMVDDQFTSAPDYVDESYFGVAAGQERRYELGASLNATYNFTIVENITIGNKLSLYSNYLKSPGNVDINYLAHIKMKVNDFVSAKFIFQAIYDDNAVGAFQIREVSGLGLSYTL